MPSLRCITGGGPKPRGFPVFKKITSIGRGAANDVSLPESKLAPHHAHVVFDGRDFNVVAVDPEAPLSINGKRRKKMRLAHNDHFSLAEVEFVFSLYDEVALDSTTTGSSAAELAGFRRLYEFSQRLLGRTQLGELLEALMDSVVELTGADKGFLILLDQGRPEIRVARNLRRENIDDSVRQLSDSILRRVVETREPVIVSDALNDAEFKTSESVMSLKLCSVMCVPLVEQGNLLGAIYVGNDNVVSLFDERMLDVLVVFAGQASLILRNAMFVEELRTDNQQLREQLNDKRFGEIIGSCPSMLEVFRKVEKVARTDISVLITGETGTGKELIACELHARSARASGPFVAINCGAIPENLIESELFGHVRGAFTGAVATRPGKFHAANGGTIFLDEIGELPVALQVKLLRTLQDKVVVKVGDSKPEQADVRVIAATNKHLEDEIRRGAFREDLYYRLNVVNIFLPPLRERGEDLVVIAKYLLQKYAEEYGSKVKGFTPNALIAIRKYEWPGNVRQVENRIKKALVLCERSLIGPEDLDLTPESLAPVTPLAQAKEEFQRRYVMEVLERNGGNRTKTARDLGVDPRTIFRYLEREGEGRGGDVEGGEEFDKTET